MSSSPPPQASQSLEAAADAAASRGDAATARWLLEQVVAAEPERGEPWMKLAAMCRATGDPEASLEAVGGALRIDPLAFVPLLMKARLLLALGREEEAGETFGYALAQRPDSIPPELQGAVADAEARHAAHQAARLQRLDAVAQEADAPLTPPERRRLERFRSNIVRLTRPFHCEPTHFHYPGLVEREFHDPEHFPWLADFAGATEAIRADFERVMAAERAELVPYIQYPDDVPVRQWAELNHNRAWTAIHLIRSGNVVEANARHCPETMALLGRIEQAAIPGFGPNAMFSLLAPGAHIPPHTGVANTRLVCHVPLVVPEKCWFRVGAETREWRLGEPFVFDDTIEHEAANESAELRVVLIFDLWHPGLSAAERQGVTAAIRASGLAPSEAAL
jgi:aspartyl/asparaginyl beta-hydroxylase (cupin superfamily)